LGAPFFPWQLDYDCLGTPFVGMLFTGVMLTKSGPKCLEYSARFGDPKAQTLVPLLESDLAEIMLACITGNLHQVDLVIEEKFRVAVILASGGYPGEYQQGYKIKFREYHSDSTDLRCMSTEQLVEEYVVQSVTRELSRCRHET